MWAPIGLDMAERAELSPACTGWSVTGPLRVKALRSTLRAVDPGLPCTVLDLRFTSDHDEELRDIGSAEVELAAIEDAPVRIALARLTDSRCVLLVITRRVAARRAIEGFVRDLLVGCAALEEGADEPDAVLSARRFVTARRDAGSGGEPSADRSEDSRYGARRPGAAGTVSVSAGEHLSGLEAWCVRRSLPFSAAMLAGVFTVMARHGGGRQLTVDVDVDEGNDAAGPAVATPADATSPSAVRLEWSDQGTTGDLVSRVATAMRQSPAEPSGGCGAVRFRFEDRRAPVAVAGYEVAAVDVPVGRAANELTFSVVREAEDLRFGLDFDRDVRDQDTAVRLVERLNEVWGALAAEPALAELTAVTSEERRAVTRDWQGATEPYSGECLHQLIETQARLRPDRPAVVCGTGRLDYRRLNTWANQVSRRLRALGVGPETVVAVAADRSAESVVGMLAVLKAGGCYLPVDPAYPIERLRQMISDSGASIAVSAGPSLLPELAVSRVDILDADVLGEDGSDPEPAATPRNLAYVIYTSGSTGTPKGVMVSHSSIVCSTHARRVGGEPPGVDLVTMPLSFDGSAGGMYWALTTGGTVLLPTEDEVRDPHRLAAIVAEWRVTDIHSVPSTYGMVLEACDPAALSDLRLVSVGGEPLPPDLVARHIATCPDALLLNDYGPTEGAVWASAHRCGPEDTTRAVPIGRPLPNYRMYVLDEGLRPVPPGVPGELCLSGDGTARGYLGNPGLTSARFLPDPYSGLPGARLYRTGDRARQRPDGTLEILGRMDRQVKVRGFRIELGEIEEVLRRHPAVGEAVVVVAKAGRLVAFVVSGDPDCTAPDLRDWLAARLPSHMVPDRLRLLESLPRNHNGKTDAAALLAMADELQRRP